MKTGAVSFFCNLCPLPLSSIIGMWIRRKLLGLSLLGVLLGTAALAQEQKQVPEKPDNLRVFTRFDGAVGVAELNWRDQSENELGFEILRSDNGREFRVVGMVGANTARYEDRVGKYITGAFAYKVRAFNEAGKSQESNTVSVWF